MKLPVRLAMLVALTLMIVGCGSSGDRSGAPVGAFAPHSFTLGGVTRQYTVYTPPNYNPQTKYPTILFLHGRFEGGSNNTSQTKVGLGEAIRNHPERFKCIAVFPQAAGSWSDEESWPQAIAALDDASRRYSVDQTRVTATGLSNGGFACWHLGGLYPNRFAGLMPLCAFEDEPSIPRLTSMPVWALHNKMDYIVGPGNATTMVEGINKLGGKAKITLYGGFGHNCWDEAYSDPSVINWLLSQKRG